MRRAKAARHITVRKDPHAGCVEQLIGLNMAYGQCSLRAASDPYSSTFPTIDAEDRRTCDSVLSPVLKSCRHDSRPVFTDAWRVELECEPALFEPVSAQRRMRRPLRGDGLPHFRRRSFLCPKAGENCEFIRIPRRTP